MKKLKQTINDITTEGIFKELFSIDNGSKLEWLTNDNYNLYDLEYYLSHSGEKEISLLFYNLIDLQEESKIESAINKIAKIIYNKYSDNWVYLYNAIMADYDPIENYNGVEDTTFKVNVDTSTKSNTKEFAFNSSYGKDSTEVYHENKGNAENNFTTNHVEKHGNLGVTTSQQMIQSEIELRKQTLIDIIYTDIDSLLCNLYY